MLTRIAAIVVAVAVAIGPLHAAADEPGHVHVKLRFVDDGEKKTQVTTQITKQQDEGIMDYPPPGDYCPGMTQVEVMGVDGIFCVENTPCGGYTAGECPGPQAGLEFGSTCVATENGGLACVPAAYFVDDFQGGSGDSGDEGSWSNDYGSWGNDEGSWDDDGSGDDEEGSGDAAEGSGDDGGSWADGGSWDGFDTWGEDDPDSSASGEFPWYGWADSSGWGEGSGGGYWFGSGYGDASGGDDSHPVCSYGQSPMSVEGVEGYFCVSGESCVGEIMGTCPEPQPGLEYGAYCGTVASGVFGCKPMTEDMYNSLYLPAGGDDSGSDLVDTYVCEDGLYSISVEGVEGVFCVPGPICVADTVGTCPEAQAGLEFGSYCDVVQSGVLGCKPYTSAPTEDSTSGSGSKPTEENDPTLPVVDYPFCSAEGDSQMSVEGVPGVFCVNGQACAGVDGVCPGPQPGLEFGSYCGTVQSGVKGCVPNVPTKKSAFKKVHTNKHKPAGKKTHPAKPHARQH